MGPIIASNLGKNMNRERPALPDRAQIEGIASVSALEELLKDVQESKTEIEAQLEFSSRDEEWEARAIRALTAHRICEQNIRRHLSKLTGKRGPTTGEAQDAKTQRKAAQADLEQAAAQRRANDLQALKLHKLQEIKNTLAKGSYLAAFHQAAHAFLDEATCRHLTAEAQRIQNDAVMALVAHVAPELEAAA